MPEMKRNFTGGKMNKDLDERLVPNGEYRHAMNVQVSSSDGDNVGSIQNILGNKNISQTVYDGSLRDVVLPAGSKCVGSIADEKNDVAYWFLVKDGNTQSAILRCFKNSNDNLETGIVLCF